MFPFVSPQLHSHKEWRKVAKKIRRKHFRQKVAKERDRLLEEGKVMNLL